MKSPDHLFTGETAPEAHIEAIQEDTHTKIGGLGRGVEIGSDIVFKTLNATAYSIGRGARGVFDIGKALKGGLQKKSFHQSI